MSRPSPGFSLSSRSYCLGRTKGNWPHPFHRLTASNLLRCMSSFMALFGHGVMSNFIPLCATKRTPADHTEFMKAHALEQRRSPARFALDDASHRQPQIDLLSARGGEPNAAPPIQSTQAVSPDAPSERMDLSHCQRNPLLRVLPREHAHFGLRRQHRRLHRDGIRMRWNIVRHDQHRRLAVAHESRVTVKTKSAGERYIWFRYFSTISIVMSGRRLISPHPSPSSCRHRERSASPA